MAFKENEIDPSIMDELEKEDLRDLGISNAIHRAKIVAKWKARRAEEAEEGNTAKQNGLAQSRSALVALELSNNRLGAEGTGLLSSALRKNNTLTALGLAANNVGLHGSATLVDVLQAVDCALKKLDLSNNNLALGGAALLAEAIGKNVSLCHLSLRSNQFGEQGTKLLMDSLGAQSASARLVSIDLGSGELGLDGLLVS